MLQVTFSHSLSRIFQSWRGKAGGPHQLVVTMEDLAGPHAVPIRIPRVAARRQESSVDTDAFLPRIGGFPALQPRRHLLGAERKTGFKKHLHGWIMW